MFSTLFDCWRAPAHDTQKDTLLARTRRLLEQASRYQGALSVLSNLLAMKMLCMEGVLFHASLRKQVFRHSL